MQVVLTAAVAASAALPAEHTELDGSSDTSTDSGQVAFKLDLPNDECTESIDDAQ